MFMRAVAFFATARIVMLKHIRTEGIPLPCFLDFHLYKKNISINTYTFKPKHIL